eukprot:6954879-Heterocapsa_arctica.AAC.1
MDSWRSFVLSAVRRFLSFSASCANSFSFLASLSASGDSRGAAFPVPATAARPFRRSSCLSLSFLFAVSASQNLLLAVSKD